MLLDSIPLPLRGSSKWKYAGFPRVARRPASPDLLHPWLHSGTPPGYKGKYSTGAQRQIRMKSEFEFGMKNKRRPSVADFVGVGDPRRAR